MGYTKKWIPAAAPTPNDLSSWLVITKELHDNLLAAGLQPTDTPGQLDLDAVDAVPANGTYSGFIEYDFNDPLQATAPIRLKLEYGAGATGLYDGNYASNSRRGRVPFVRCTVYFKGNPSTVFACPQSISFTPRGTQNAGDNGMSWLAYNETFGFLGVVHGAGAHTIPPSGSQGSYIGAHFTLFIRRSSDANGVPTEDGCALYYNGMNAGISSTEATDLWSTKVIPPAFSEYLSAGSKYRSGSMAVRIGGVSNSVIDGDVYLQPIFYQANEFKEFNWILSYVTNISSPVIPEGTEMAIEIFPGEFYNFVALGNKTGIGVDEVVGQRAGVAMLFE